MKYLKLLMSTILAMLIATAIIWFSLFAIVFSVLSVPISSWWKKFSLTKKDYVTTAKSASGSGKAPYKVIEAEYKIISTTER